MTVAKVKQFYEDITLDITDMVQKFSIYVEGDIGKYFRTKQLKNIFLVFLCNLQMEWLNLNSQTLR